MSTTTTTADGIPKEDAREAKRRQRRAIRLTLQFFPLAMGLVGLFLISSWSLEMRLEQPDVEATSYYLGLALVLIALQMPLLLEINRRRTKRFMQRRLLMALAVLISILLVIAYHVAPKVDYDEVLDQELPLLDDLYD